MLSGNSTLRKCSFLKLRQSFQRFPISVFRASFCASTRAISMLFFIWLVEKKPWGYYSESWLVEKRPRGYCSESWLVEKRPHEYYSESWLVEKRPRGYYSESWLVEKGPEDIILSPDWMRNGPEDIILSPDWLDRSRPSVRVAGSSFSPDQFLYLNIAQV